MPTIHDNVDVDVMVYPGDFLSECSRKELQETYEMLLENYGMGEQEEKIRSEGQRNFNRHLTTLRESWISVSKEDAQIIEVLGKKYGAV